jgi:hypothetical protein
MPQRYARLARGSAAGRAAEASGRLTATTFTSRTGNARPGSLKSAEQPSSSVACELTRRQHGADKKEPPEIWRSRRNLPTVAGGSMWRGISYHPGEGKSCSRNLLAGREPCQPGAGAAGRSIPGEGCRGLELAGELLEAPGRPAPPAPGSGTAARPAPWHFYQIPVRRCGIRTYDSLTLQRTTLASSGQDETTR